MNSANLAMKQCQSLPSLAIQRQLDAAMQGLWHTPPAADCDDSTQHTAVSHSGNTQVHYTQCEKHKTQYSRLQFKCASEQIS